MLNCFLHTSDIDCSTAFCSHFRAWITAVLALCTWSWTWSLNLECWQTWQVCLCVHVCMHRADGTNTCSIQTLQVCLYAARLCLCSKVFLFKIDLEIISFNHAFQWGFHYHRGDIHLKWMPILFYRAFQMVFFIVKLQRAVF